MMLEKVQQLFAVFGTSVGFDEMGQNGKTTYRLDYDSGLVVNIDYMDDLGRFMLAAPILNLPSLHNTEAYMDLLELNLAWDELAGGRFALLGQEKLVMLVRQLDVAVATDDSFVEDVSAFIEAAEVWFDTLNGGLENEDTGMDGNIDADLLKV